MSRFAGLGATAIRFTALAKGMPKTSRRQIAEFGNLGLDAFTLSYQIGNGWIGPLC